MLYGLLTVILVAPRGDHAVIKAGIVTSSYADDDERIKIITPEDVKAVLEK